MIKLCMDSYQPVRFDTGMFAMAFYDSRNPADRIKWSEPLNEKEFREYLGEMGMTSHQVEQLVEHAVPRHFSQT